MNGVETTALVVGGGIVGVCTALNLQRRGFAVTIVEKEEISAGASTGNCGLMAVGEIVPVSRPGILSQLPGWLLDPEGPVSVKPFHALTMMPWLFKFLRAGKLERVNSIANALTQLSNFAHDAYKPLLEESGITGMLKSEEVIYLFDSQKELDHDRFSWDLRERCGFSSDYLNFGALHDLEPEISPQVECGMLMKGWNYFSDPKRLTQTLAKTFCENGGSIVFSKVTGFSRNNDRVDAVLLADGRSIRADEVIIATGAWSSALASQLGEDLPVEAMAGYNTTIADPGLTIDHPLLHHKGGFVLTPMEMGLRVGGTLELGGMTAKPNFNRAKIIAKKAQAILPRLRISQETEWVGYRPMTPDTLPIIDRSKNAKNVTYASGHGQLGITYGALTGEIVADLIEKGSSNKFDLSPYRLNRF